MKPEVTKEDPEQLAEDLVAFALQLEPAGDLEHEQMCPEERSKVKIVDEDVDMEDSYVYETYVRVTCGPVPRPHLALYQPPNTIGVLVIGEDDEEVWEAFVESGEDSDWDEEDADSNGKPAMIASSTSSFDPRKPRIILATTIQRMRSARTMNTATMRTNTATELLTMKNTTWEMIHGVRTRLVTIGLNICRFESSLTTPLT